MSRVAAIDLRDFVDGADAGRRRGLVTRLRESMLDVGFVRVVGHGIEPALCRQAHTQFERFFALDGQSKLSCGGFPGGQRGFTPFGVEHAKDHRVADLKEFYHVGQEHPGQLDSAAYPPNAWPAELPELRAVSLRLYGALERCAKTLLEALAEGFELPAEVFASMLDGGNSILRALHYPPVPSDADPRALRAAPHEDINLVTLLCEATDAGLEILSQGEWLAVEPRPGEIVADAGDMLSRMTNGHIPSTTHRVVADPASAGRHRYALPFFAHPRPECDLSVMPEFVTTNDRPRFAPISAEAFLAERLAAIGLGTASRDRG
jgi:isopenicillin N synthase-like dioxygenase